MGSLAEWANLPPEHNLAKFAAQLPTILDAVGYNEMYGVELIAQREGSATPPHSTLLILQKLLRANADDLAAAQNQLTAALQWRKDYHPLKAKDELFDSSKFGGLGFVSRIHNAPATKNGSDVVTYNIYGAATKDTKKTFGNLDEFVRWRVALQELAIAQLGLNEGTQPIPDYGKGPDPYTAVNVHDYLSVSFFRQPPEVKASSSKIIDMFQKYYPETVSYKYFVNVPLVMQWMMGAMKALMSKDSVQKMTWLTWGSELHKYLGSDLPREYGGTGTSLAKGATTPRYSGNEVVSDAVPGADPRQGEV